MVLLHGQPGTAAVWCGVVAALGGRVTSMVPDRIGYGRTGGAAGDFADNAAAVAALVAEAALGPAVLVGHSWGGGVALATAIEAPASVAGLVLVASVSPTVAASGADRLLAWPALGEAVALATVGATTSVIGSSPSRRWLVPRIPGPLGAYLRSVPAGRPPWRAFLVEQRAYVTSLPGLAPYLGDIDVPTIVLTGTQDRTVPPSTGAALADAIPAATLVELPGVGHLVPFRAPGPIAAAIHQVVGGRPA